MIDCIVGFGLVLSEVVQQEVICKACRNVLNERIPSLELLADVTVLSVLRRLAFLMEELCSGRDYVPYNAGPDTLVE